MWLLEIVEKMHAKRNNICGSPPEYATKIEGCRYFCISFPAVLYTIKYPLTGIRKGKVPPNQLVIFIFNFATSRQCGNILQPVYSQVVAKAF